jgi:hypothetical protein
MGHLIAHQNRVSEMEIGADEEARAIVYDLQMF